MESLSKTQQNLVKFNQYIRDRNEPLTASRPAKSASQRDIKEFEDLKLRTKISTKFELRIREFIKKIKLENLYAEFKNNKVYITKDCGFKRRKAFAREVGIRYNDDSTITCISTPSVLDSFPEIEKVKVINGESSIKENEEKVLQGGYNEVCSNSELKEKLLKLKDNSIIIDHFNNLYKNTDKPVRIDAGFLGEMRASMEVAREYENDEDILIINSVHFKGKDHKIKTKEGAMLDIESELDHLVIRKVEGKYVVVGIFNTKAGSNSNGHAKKQNDASCRALIAGSQGTGYNRKETESKKDSKEEVSYDFTLQKIYGQLYKGFPLRDSDINDKGEFVFEIGNYLVLEGVTKKTIGGGTGYGVGLPSTKILGVALSYIFYYKKKHGNNPPGI